MLSNGNSLMNNYRPIITSYSPISSKGGAKKRKSRKFKNCKNKINKSRTRRRYR